jgi:hypothetical protein
MSRLRQSSDFGKRGARTLRAVSTLVESAGSGDKRSAVDFAGHLEL